VCPLFPPTPKNLASGVTQVVYSISKELVRRGHTVEVYTSGAVQYGQQGRTENKTGQVLVDGIRVHYFPYAMHYYTFFVTPTIISTAKKSLREYDLIHIHDFRTFQGIVVAHYARKFKIPYVVQAHGTLGITPSIKVPRDLPRRILDSTSGFKSVKNASKVIAVSQVEMDEYRALGVSEEKIEKIPNGIDLSEYADLPPRGSFRKEFGIAYNEKVVLYLGRIHKIKGIDILVRAFGKVIEKLDEVRLVIAGPDDGYLRELQALIKALRVSHGILMTGPLYGKNKLEAYVDADVFVSPSRYEIWGMTILEAIACGTPVVVTDKCGMSEFIKAKVGLVTKTEPGHVAEALLEILQDESKRNSFRRNCKKVVGGLSISKTVSQLEEVYKQIADLARMRVPKLV
jgi:glycosyltransferase involved in cell wall biosynthesis